MPQVISAKTSIQIVREAVAQGRAVVPFLGAGLSAASGFPLINGLRDYLCKVRFFIEQGVYRQLLGEPIGVARGSESPEFNPSRYIDCFGWPDINQLDADLWSFASSTSEYTRIIAKTLPDEGQELRKKNPNWGVGRWRLQSIIHKVIYDDMLFHDQQLASRIQEHLVSFQLKPRIDWFRYMLDLAGGRRGLVDSLFTQLNARREPSLGHIMLAHLAKDFGWRLILTINFDTLIEAACRNERLEPTVFEVSRETLPPDPSVVNRSQLALIKLHGGAFDLRIGEPIDYSLDEQTKQHILGAIPDDALLLVIGFSGYERRMMQLIEELLLRKTRDKRLKRTRVLWMHWEEEGRLPATIKQLKGKLIDVGESGFEESLATRRLTDAGSFLLEAYQHITDTLPSGVQPYSALPKRVLRARPAKSSDGDASRVSKKTLNASDIESKRERPIHLFVRESLVVSEIGETRTPLLPGLILDDDVPSLSMSDFVQSLSDYQVIWIDLEDHHTVSGIVGEIIQKMRSFDPHLPDLLLPVDNDTLIMHPLKESEQFDKAVRYIHRALRRGRYAIAFDSLEGFGREQTAHHGLPTDIQSGSTKRRRPVERLNQLLTFLGRLIREEHRVDWHCCISIDEPTSRHISNPMLLATDADSPRTIEKPLTAQVRDRIGQFCRELQSSPDLTGKIDDVLIGAPEKRSSDTSDFGPKDDSLYEFRKMLDHLNRCTPEAGAFLQSIQQDGWGIGWNCLDAAILEVVDGSGEISALASYLILTVFRRPRSYAAVYSVLKVHATKSPNAMVARPGRRAYKSWLSRTLQDLQKQTSLPSLLYYMDGGHYWVPHHVHEWTYKLVSEVARRQAVDRSRFQDKWLSNDWSVSTSFTGNRDFHRGELRLNRLLFLASTHTRIARFYYMHAYARSRDVIPLFEYLYHRMSVLKYLVTLFSMLCIYETGQNEASRQAYNAASSRIGERLETLCSRDGIPCMKGLDPKSIVALCLTNLTRRLLNVINREVAIILSRGTADTWLSWIETLQQELRGFGLGRSGENASSFSTVPLVDEFKRLRYELDWKLNELRVRLLREKGAGRVRAQALLVLMFDKCHRTICLAREMMAETEAGSTSPAEQKTSIVLQKLIAVWDRFCEIYPFSKSTNIMEETTYQAFGAMNAEKLSSFVQAFVKCLDFAFKPPTLQALLVQFDRDPGASGRDLSRFLWCYRELCACLRHFVRPEVRDYLIGRANDWMNETISVLESSRT